MEKKADIYEEDEFLRPELRAGGFIRSVSFFYDAVVLSMFLFMFGAMTTLWMMINTETEFLGDPMRARREIMENEPHLMIVNYGVLLIVFIFCHFIYPAMKKQSFGMMFTDLVLVDENRKPLTTMHYIKRELLKLVLFPTFFLAFGTDRRPLYDKLSKSYLMKY